MRLPRLPRPRRRRRDRPLSLNSNIKERMRSRWTPTKQSQSLSHCRKPHSYVILPSNVFYLYLYFRNVILKDWDPYLFDGYELESTSTSSTSSTSMDAIAATYSANVLLAPAPPEKEDQGAYASVPYYLDDGSDSSSENAAVSPPPSPSPPLTSSTSSSSTKSPRPSLPELPPRPRAHETIRIPGKNNVDWNKAFQKILVLPDSFKKYQQLSSLYRDFCYAAKTYGRIIISEKFLPRDEKTIKPIDAGGIAGGIKYLVSGILFKFAVDTYNERSKTWLYGFDARDDAAAGASCCPCPFVCALMSLSLSKGSRARAQGPHSHV